MSSGHAALSWTHNQAAECSTGFRQQAQMGACYEIADPITPTLWAADEIKKRTNVN